MRRLIVILFLTSIVSSVDAQNKFLNLREANYHYDNFDFYSAEYFYELAYQKDSSDLDLMWKLAETYRLNYKYSRAKILYQKISKRDVQLEFLNSTLWESIMYKHVGEYQKAESGLRKYLTLNKDPLDFLYRKALMELKGAQMALEMEASRDSVRRLDETINSRYSDFSPFPVGDNILYFSSLVKTDAMEKEHFLKHQSKLFISKNEELSDLFEGFQSLDSHVGNISFNTENNQAFFTKCTSSEDGIDCVIFSSNKINSLWEEPTPMRSNINEINSNNTHPKYGVWNNIEGIFFSSNRLGGFGEMDIWFAPLHEGAAINLGNIINTLGNEITPFYNSVENIIYFSSDFHPGIGGFDIFASSWDTYWSTALNLQSPINSTHNDLYYISLSDNPLEGYLSSNRKGSTYIDDESCCNDIYYFVKSKKCFCEEVDSLLDSIESRFPIRLYFDNDHPNPDSRDTISNINYASSYELYFKERENYIRRYSAALSGNLKGIAELNMKNFFDVSIKNGFLDLEFLAKELRVAMEYETIVEIKIKGFTSPLNDIDYNLSLAKRRISSVVNYFIEYDNSCLSPFIESGHIIFTALPFGESQADNQISDNPNDRKNSVFNIKAASERRIEIQSISIKL